MGISRQAYYKRNRAIDGRAKESENVARYVRQLRMRQPRIGTRKLHHLLHQQADAELKVGRDRLFSMLRAHRLLVLPKRAYHKTTNSFHRFYQHPNLLKNGSQQVLATESESVWVADITYLPGQKSPLYLSVVTDAFSRKIVGHHVHQSLHADSVAMAFKTALRRRRKSRELIHHSDRGIQYCSTLYQALHTRHGVRCSMTDGYDCYQNALAERINGILKMELLPERFESIEQARKLVDEAVRIYNTERPHLALEYKTPEVVHRAF